MYKLSYCGKERHPCKSFDHFPCPSQEQGSYSKTCQRSRCSQSGGQHAKNAKDMERCISLWGRASDCCSVGRFIWDRWSLCTRVAQKEGLYLKALTTAANRVLKKWTKKVVNHFWFCSKNLPRRCKAVLGKCTLTAFQFNPMSYFYGSPAEIIIFLKYLYLKAKNLASLYSTSSWIFWSWTKYTYFGKFPVLKLNNCKKKYERKKGRT